MVYSYYEAGRMIVEEEQQGKERAEYVKYILKQLSEKLTKELGRGFSYDNLKLMRKFYLSWSQYLILMRISNKDERHFYEIESYRNGWNKNELSRQYGSSLYGRLALSRDKDEVMRLALEGQVIESPEDIFKDPYVLEFTGLPEMSLYSESDLEEKIIDHLQQFLLELGRCFVLFDLKIGKLKHEDIGQMQMYVNYYDRKIKLEEENPTIGIIICKDKKDAVIEMTLPENNNQIFASKYQTVLPSKEELQQLLEDRNLE